MATKEMWRKVVDSERYGASLRGNSTPEDDLDYVENDRYGSLPDDTDETYSDTVATRDGNSNEVDDPDIGVHEKRLDCGSQVEMFPFDEHVQALQTDNNRQDGSDDESNSHEVPDWVYCEEQDGDQHFTAWRTSDCSPGDDNLTDTFAMDNTCLGIGPGALAVINLPWETPWSKLEPITELKPTPITPGEPEEAGKTPVTPKDPEEMRAILHDHPGPEAWNRTQDDSAPWATFPWMYFAGAILALDGVALYYMLEYLYPTPQHKPSLEVDPVSGPENEEVDPATHSWEFFPWLEFAAAVLAEDENVLQAMLDEFLPSRSATELEDSPWEFDLTKYLEDAELDPRIWLESVAAFLTLDGEELQARLNEIFPSESTPEPENLITDTNQVLEAENGQLVSDIQVSEPISWLEFAAAFLAEDGYQELQVMLDDLLPSTSRITLEFEYPAPEDIQLDGVVETWEFIPWLEFAAAMLAEDGEELQAMLDDLMPRPRRTLQFEDSAPENIQLNAVDQASEPISWLEFAAAVLAENGEELQTMLNKLLPSPLTLQSETPASEDVQLDSIVYVSEPISWLEFAAAILAEDGEELQVMLNELLPSLPILQSEDPSLEIRPIDE